MYDQSALEPRSAWRGLGLRFAIWVMAVTFIVSAGSARALEVPRIGFETGSVVASGVTPGGETLMIGISKRWAAWQSSVDCNAEFVVDGDQDGRVELDPPGGLERASMWAVVDLSTGIWAVAGPQGSPIRAVESRMKRLPATFSSERSRVQLAGRSLEVFAVRPKVGAWRLPASDAGSADRDGTPDGNLVVDFAESTPIGASPELESVRKGDLILAFEPYRFEWFVQPLSGPVKRAGEGTDR